MLGSDYPTPDGSGVRDYIHVQDLAAGHVAALQCLLARGESFNVNLGTGRGYGVLQVTRAFQAASGRRVPYKLVDRRPGDVAQCYADPSLAKRLLGWAARHGLDEMCRDAWRWQSWNLADTPRRLSPCHERAPARRHHCLGRSCGADSVLGQRQDCPAECPGLRKPERTLRQCHPSPGTTAAQHP